VVPSPDKENYSHNIRVELNHPQGLPALSVCSKSVIMRPRLTVVESVNGLHEVKTLALAPSGSVIVTGQR
jgi:hypothetical protein